MKLLYPKSIIILIQLIITTTLLLYQRLGEEDLVLMKKSVKIVKQMQVQSGVEVPVDIKRKEIPPIIQVNINNILLCSLCNACGLRYARSVAKNEKQQEDLYGKFKNANTSK